MLVAHSEQAGVEHVVIVFVQRREDVGVNHPIAAGRACRAQLGAQRYTSVKDLQRVVDAVRPAAELATVFDEAPFDLFK
jgi:hypothetical protein